MMVCCWNDGPQWCENNLGTGFPIQGSQNRSGWIKESGDQYSRADKMQSLPTLKLELGSQIDSEVVDG